MIISPTTKIAAVTGLVCLTVGTLCGIGIGWKLYQPTQIAEAYKPAQQLKNDVVALERKPEQPVPTEIKVAAKELKGKLTRTASITLQPKPSANNSTECKCDEITVDVGLVDEGDGNRIIIHSDEATIIKGTDNPLEPYTMARQDKWEVGVAVPIDYPEGVGPTVARRIGPFKVGVAATRSREDGWTGMVTASISF